MVEFSMDQGRAKINVRRGRSPAIGTIETPGQDRAASFF